MALILFIAIFILVGLFCLYIISLQNQLKASIEQAAKFNEAVDRIVDMYKSDDGQAWKEARKFLDKEGQLHRINE